MQLDKLNTDGLKALQSFSSQTAEIVQDYIKDIGKSTLSDKDKIISALNLIKEKEESFLKLHQSEYKSTTSDTFEHSFAVAKIMKEYAKQKGMSEEMQDVYYIIGIVHDIGKIAIDNNILLKKKKKRVEKLCTNCPHIYSRHYAKGMCSNCYHSKGRIKKPWNCPHVNKAHYALGLCQNCYQIEYIKKQSEIHGKKFLAVNLTEEEKNNKEKNDVCLK